MVQTQIKSTIIHCCRWQRGSSKERWRKSLCKLSCKALLRRVWITLLINSKGKVIEQKLRSLESTTLTQAIGKDELCFQWKSLAMLSKKMWKLLICTCVLDTVLWTTTLNTFVSLKLLCHICPLFATKLGAAIRLNAGHVTVKL